MMPPQFDFVANATMRVGLRGCALLALMCVFAVSWPAMGAERLAVPDFSSDGVGWITESNDFAAPTQGPGPVTFDPAHPYIPNDLETPDAPRRQPTFRIADLSNPILMPWVRDALKKTNDDVLAGKAGLTPANSCWPAGTPAILLIRRAPMFILQTPKMVWMVWQNDHQSRRIYLNQNHSKDPKPSWFGESVGHYEGDALIIDTIGITTDTPLDNYGTRHSEKLHIVERYRAIDGGKTLEVKIRIEDPAAFTTPWTALQHFRRTPHAELVEEACAENNANYLNDIGPLPTAAKPDF